MSRTEENAKQEEYDGRPSPSLLAVAPETAHFQTFDPESPESVRLYVASFVSLTSTYTRLPQGKVKDQIRAVLYGDARKKLSNGRFIILQAQSYRDALATIIKASPAAEQTALIALIPAKNTPQPGEAQGVSFSDQATDIYYLRELCGFFALTVTNSRPEDEAALTPYMAAGDAIYAALSNPLFYERKEAIIRARAFSLSLYRRGFTQEGAEKVVKTLLSEHDDEASHSMLEMMNLNFGQFIIGFKAILEGLGGAGNMKILEKLPAFYQDLAEEGAYSLPHSIYGVPLPATACAFALTLPGGVFISGGGERSDAHLAGHALPGGGKIVYL